MVKVSRPIIWLVVLGAAGYAAVIFTEPDAVKKKATANAAAHSGVTPPPGFTEADMTAKFDRYNGPITDAFKPKVVLKKPTPGASPAAQPPVATGIWTLTGIALTDGQRSALVENSNTGESVFLKAGDQWSGLKVVSVEPTEVIFVNAEGKRTRLTFAVTVEEKPSPSPSGLAPLILPAPGASPAPGAAAPGAVPAAPGTVPPAGTAPPAPRSN